MSEAVFQKRLTRGAGVATLILMLAGCAVQAPHQSLPQADSNTLVSLENALPMERSKARDDAGRWWSALGDPQLDRLIELALDENRTLEAALSRLDAQLARLELSRDLRRPQGGLAGNLNLSR